MCVFVVVTTENETRCSTVSVIEPATCWSDWHFEMVKIPAFLIHKFFMKWLGTQEMWKSMSIHKKNPTVTTHNQVSLTCITLSSHFNSKSLAKSCYTHMSRLQLTLVSRVTESSLVISNFRLYNLNQNFFTSPSQIVLMKCHTKNHTCDTENLTCNTDNLTCNTDNLTCNTDNLTCDTETSSMISNICNGVKVIGNFALIVFNIPKILF